MIETAQRDNQGKNYCRRNQPDYRNRKNLAENAIQLLDDIEPMLQKLQEKYKLIILS